MEKYVVLFYGDSGVGPQIDVAKIMKEADIIYVPSDENIQYIQEKYGREVTIGGPPSGIFLKVICPCTCSGNLIARELQDKGLLYQLREKNGADIQLIYSQSYARACCEDRILTYKKYFHECDPTDQKIVVDVENL